MRGTTEAFKNLPVEQRYNDTLYFIADPDAATGELWLGNTLIASGATEGTAATKLSELLDVDVSNVQHNQYLGYDINKQKWVPLDILITIDKVQGLQEALDNKVNKVYYSVPVLDANGDPVLDENGEQIYEQVEGSLLSPTDQDKLDALVITEDGVEISGTVNAANVEDLNIWITKHRNEIAGLYPTTAEENVAKALSDLNQLNATTTTLSNRIDQVANELTNYVNMEIYLSKMNSLDSSIDTLKQSLTWQTI